MRNFRAASADLFAAAPHTESIRRRPPTHSLPVASLTVYSAASLHAEFPAVTVGVVKPKSHVRRTWPFRTNLVTRIFDFDFVFFQMRQRFSQDRHIGQMK
jgi:hypothetical protein